ncbi:MAG TPA: choice-of-anchor L domain-containing protein, partial [Candidatus Hydrogenedentes bacterium]|nr:choice-of-anchor L domain-containing protein [Candidatus Hydrogenedentota bacterium]
MKKHSGMFNIYGVVNRVMLAGAVFALLALGISPMAAGQSAITVTAGEAPEQLVKEEFIQGCLQAENVTLVKGNSSERIGYFTRVEGGDFPLESGIVLSTGKVSEMVGPNTETNHEHQFNTNGDDDLWDFASSLWGAGSAYLEDTVSLEFDFIPVGDVVEFRYIFASEHYPVCGNNWNDVFGFFVSGPGISGSYSNDAINIALLPNGAPVTIRDIHPNVPFNILNPFETGCSASNSEYYVDVPVGSPTISYDGRTTVLTARMENLVPCATYHIKLALADGSPIAGLIEPGDSGVFLEAKSFSSAEGMEIKSFQNGTETYDAFQGCGTTFLRFLRPPLLDESIQVDIDYDVAGSAVSGVHHTLANGTVSIPAFAPFADIPYTLLPAVLDGPKAINIIAYVGCPCLAPPTTLEKTINIYDPFVLDYISHSNVSDCVYSDGTITVKAEPGAAPFDYQFSYKLYKLVGSVENFWSTSIPPSGQPAIFQFLPAGAWKVKVTDGVSCNIQERTVTISAPDAPIVTVFGTSKVCNGGTISFFVDCNIPDENMTWEWSGPNGFFAVEKEPSIPNAAGADSGTYYLVATSSIGAECSAFASLTIEVSPDVTCPAGLAICADASPVNLASLGASPAFGEFSGPGVT